MLKLNQHETIGAPGIGEACVTTKIFPQNPGKVTVAYYVPRSHYEISENCERPAQTCHRAGYNGGACALWEMYLSALGERHV